MSALQEALIAAIRAALKEDGASQADLARHVGISQRHLSWLLNGRSEGSVDMWSRLLMALGIVILDLPIATADEVMPWRGAA